MERRGLALGVGRPLRHPLFPAELDPVVAVHTRSSDAARQALLDRDDTFRFDAHTPDGRYAARTWLHLTDDVAGLYEMAVRP